MIEQAGLINLLSISRDNGALLILSVFIIASTCSVLARERKNE